MIKNYKTVSVPKVSLGNLGLNNATSFYVPKDPREYPIARFGRPIKGGNTFSMYTDKPENCPEDMKILEQYDDPFERLAEYAKDLENEHSDLSDERMLELGENHYSGRKRNARWHDELLRRGLIRK